MYSIKFIYNYKGDVMFEELFNKYATDEYHNVAGRVMTYQGFELAMMEMAKGIIQLMEEDLEVETNIVKLEIRKIGKGK